LRITTPLRTALDIARSESLEHGVAVLDAFLRAKLTTLRDLDRAAERAAGPGRIRLQRAIGLVDPEAGSILESLTRVLLWRHGLPLVRDLLDNRHTNETGVA
jgi:hypothetical protein